MEIEITPGDIGFSEEILLPNALTFNKERVRFIRNLATIDLQAVPGSGKTTALLAKLLILEKHLPFENGSGILVISHTNAAIDEIRNRIGKYCPKLLKYPNYLGTIQSFVDVFLAIPFGHNYLNSRISWIDSEKYQEALWNEFSKIYWDDQFDKPGRLFWSRLIQKAKNIASQIGKNETEVCNELIEQEVKDLYFSFCEQKIKFFRDDSTLLADDTNSKYQGIKGAIENVIRSGIISYEYAYKMALCYCKLYPEVKNLLQKRFRFVFVDEMQDMDLDQYNLLEDIFFDDGKSLSIFQRIGDKNQAIYNGIVKLDEIWHDRQKVLPLSGSYRLTKPMAAVVNCFVVDNSTKSKIVGFRDGDIKPHILVYENDTIDKVITKYVDVIKHHQHTGKLPLDPSHSFKVIAWNTDWNNKEDSENFEKIRLVEYYRKYNRENHRPKPDYDSLIGYLRYYDKEKRTLEPIRKNILNAFLKILRLEGIKDETDRQYTKRRLLNYLRDSQPQSVYDEFRHRIYEWSIGIIRGNENEHLSDIRAYVPEFLGIFNRAVDKSKNFLEANDLTLYSGEEVDLEDANTVIINGIGLEITTVHSVKGQTHCAVLYLETFYQGSYESERLCDQIKGDNFSDERKFHKQSAIMAYVGFSRGTHLLCVAIHRKRFESYLKDIDKKKWEIVKV